MIDKIRLLVGLANTGLKYTKTRHNAGSWVIEELARIHNVSLREDKKYFGLTAKISINDEYLRLLIPTTSMNRSGTSVVAVTNFLQIEPNAIMISHDELDLPLGVARFKKGGGHGGHNGLRDIISKMGNRKEFFRLRIGIGHPGHKDKVAGFVLTKAPTTEHRQIEKAVHEAVRCIDILLKIDLARAQNRLHTFKA
ncbi:aminoacyl-tRNA hydrolase [Candidatus Enterovibrio escicola]|uniref:Peptidyl-tRNA hydrolase n=1 Tax=Candidatus Enterovibrio escicola TaxID=1927127 RepID=A0A2A5SZM1_9GAMM|nr:aminoacyl-tRNA hydrolase [Candidatus Enterovibrio escacola]PCS21352.1 Peptidyl-tRNA hydrolase [Candidatus Enterovibrio escacola]